MLCIDNAEDSDERLEVEINFSFFKIDDLIKKKLLFGCAETMRDGSRKRIN